MITKSLVAAAAAAGVLLSAQPALAADHGLYGKDDPTYDGVYRQSLAILSSKAIGRSVPKDALAWLKKQQCPDGGFMAYRTGACQAPDPVNFSGEDTNSTAMAVAALWHSGAKKPARKAATWLAKHRAADGGWSYYPGSGATSDANSSALATSAVALAGRASKKFQKQSTAYLTTLQQRCNGPAAVRGGMAFDSGSTAVNDNATAQTGWMLGGGLTLPDPVRIGKATPELKCKGTGKDKASVEQASLGYLGKRLRASKGELPYGGGYPGSDYAGTAAATLAMAQAGAGRKAVTQAVAALEKNASSWISASGSDSPGSIALLILVADATGGDPKDFGGVNLVSRLAKSRQ